MFSLLMVLVFVLLASVCVLWVDVFRVSVCRFTVIGVDVLL